MANHHFLILSLPAQGHINPTLQLAKNLTRAGALVTFATTVDGLSRLNHGPKIKGLSYASFSSSDAEDTTKEKGNIASYFAMIERELSKNLPKLLQSLSTNGRPVNLLIYTYLLPWAAKVARDLNVPSAFLSIQSATTVAIYHRCFNSNNGLYDGKTGISPEVSINLPGLPLLTCNDIPSFLLPTDPHYSCLLPIFNEHIKALEEDPNTCLLVNTFDSLEASSIKAIDDMNVITIGPLVPSAFSDGNDLLDTSFGWDLFQSSVDYLQWLDSKQERSVIYVSFGSIAALQKTQKEELFHGLIEAGRPFLWVIRDPQGEEVKNMMAEKVSEQGLIVPWCSQMELLCHRSIGCFVTHCGWNSTVESLVAGVPVVGWPQFSEQFTNAKMMEEVWRTGLRAAVNEKGTVEREEIKRCLETLMGDGERGIEIRRNLVKWKGLAMEAVKEGGSSYNNMKQFLQKLG
ncbi:unnamed protein product [Ilex paraguariensis]|uniref:Glycosyltransferase n=1 Tax=Ilex paraguariensis TaxID=185542 RepID=A0ABC8SK19_9AQUA